MRNPHNWDVVRKGKWTNFLMTPDSVLLIRWQQRYHRPDTKFQTFLTSLDICWFIYKLFDGCASRKHFMRTFLIFSPICFIYYKSSTLPTQPTHAIDLFWKCFPRAHGHLNLWIITRRAFYTLTGSEQVWGLKLDGVPSLVKPLITWLSKHNQGWRSVDHPPPTHTCTHACTHTPLSGTLWWGLVIERQRRGNHFFSGCFHAQIRSPEGNDISAVQRLICYETMDVQLRDLEQVVS